MEKTIFRRMMLCLSVALMLTALMPDWFGDKAYASSWTYGITTIADDSDGIYNNEGVAVDGSGNVYIGDTYRNRVLKVDGATGAISTFAGTGTAAYSGDGGPATDAELSNPAGIAVDSSGNVYIADSGNSIIRKVDGATGIISTIAGVPGVRYYDNYNGDGIAATDAWLDTPKGVAVDGSGNVYIADTYNQRIRKVDFDTGKISTVYGDGAPATLYQPRSVAVDGSGNVYFTDTFNNRIYKKDSNGEIGEIAGDYGIAGFSGDGGAATSAKLDSPGGVAVDSSGNVYIADTSNHRIRIIDYETGIISTIAGNGTGDYSGDGGAATSAELFFPLGVAVDGSGNVYIADTGNNSVRKLVQMYTVSFGSNGGTTVDNELVMPGDTVVQPTHPTNTGYTFAGWYSDSGLTSAYDFSQAVTADITLYAKWTANNYTMAYNGNGSDGGSTPTDNTNYHYQNSVTVLGNTLTKTGYTFASWNTAADGSGDSYDPEDTLSMGASNVMLYAQWTANNYTLTYNGNGSDGGSAPTDNKNYHYEDSATVSGNTLTKTGYTFASWNTAADGSGNSYDPSDTFSIGTTNVTLYAQWTANNYTLTYNGNGSDEGSVPADNTDYHYQDDVTVSGNTLTRTGYTFVGWNTAEDGSGNSYTPNETLSMGTTNVTLYAQWTINNYSVTYDGNGSNGGSVPVDNTMYHFQDLVTVVGNTRNLTKTGFTFSGWNTVADGSGIHYTWANNTFSMGLSNVTLYAQWTANNYTVSYNGNGSDGGSVPADNTNYHYQDHITVLGKASNLTKTDYTFAGWNTAVDGSGTPYAPGTNFIVPAANTMFYAQWISNNATLSNLNISEGTLSIESPNQYTVNIDHSVTSLDVFITKGDPSQTITVTGAVYQTVTGNVYEYQASGFVVGANLIQIQVTAQDSTQIMYNLTVNRMSNNADLSGLTFSEGSLHPSFDTTITDYTATVANEFAHFTVTPTIAEAHATATISVNGGSPSSVTSGQSSDEFALNVGVNKITILVTAQNGFEKEYTVTITRERSSNANLSGLTLSRGSLTPGFASEIDTYSVNVSNGVSSLNITPTVMDGTATITVSVGGGAASPISSGTASEPLALNVGMNTIKVTVTAEDGTTKTYTITVTRAAAPSGPTVGTDKPETELAMVIDGKTEQAVATATTSVQDGQTVLTATVDAAKLAEKLEQSGAKPVLTIPVTTSADKVTAAISAEAVKAMENKNAILEVQTSIGNYKLPASEVFIDQLSGQLGAGTDLENMTIRVGIAKSDNRKVELLADAAGKGKFTVVVPPVDFTVTAEFDDKKVQVTKFNSFVEREIPLPENVDASHITTAVVLNEDGTTRSVPTKFVTRGGVTYAVIKSLTNSTYSVVWNPVTFKDVEQHWANNAVNAMGSLMIINGTGSNMYSPDRDITRAEFAAIIVRGLGLKLENEAGLFSDVKTTDWYSSAIATAHAYDLINGFADGTFRAKEKITREQAMAIIARAMEITDLTSQLPSKDEVELLSPFADATIVSEWAKSGVTDSLQAEIISGRSSSELAPKAYITRAEVAVLIQRLLKKSDLI